jgi:hypothetical protein
MRTEEHRDGGEYLLVAIKEFFSLELALFFKNIFPFPLGTAEIIGDYIQKGICDELFS